jgi:hypothetical protein
MDQLLVQHWTSLANSIRTNDASISILDPWQLLHTSTNNTAATNDDSVAKILALYSSCCFEDDNLVHSLRQCFDACSSSSIPNIVIQRARLTNLPSSEIIYAMKHLDHLPRLADLSILANDNSKHKQSRRCSSNNNSNNNRRCRRIPPIASSPSSYIPLSSLTKLLLGRKSESNDVDAGNKLKVSRLQRLVVTYPIRVCTGEALQSFTRALVPNHATSLRVLQLTFDLSVFKDDDDNDDEIFNSLLLSIATDCHKLEKLRIAITASGDSLRYRRQKYLFPTTQHYCRIIDSSVLHCLVSRVTSLDCLELVNLSLKDDHLLAIAHGLTDKALQSQTMSDNDDDDDQPADGNDVKSQQIQSSLRRLHILESCESFSCQGLQFLANVVCTRQNQLLRYCRIASPSLSFTKGIKRAPVSSLVSRRHWGDTKEEGGTNATLHLSRFNVAGAQTCWSY